ncbi:MAG: radical SAM protein [Acidilobaceae archaeon]
MRGYDPIEIAELVERKVFRVEKNSPLRMYYRFRKDKWYGGIATGDVMGCNLTCVFCWSARFKNCYERGFFLSPEKAFERIRSLQLSAELSQVRLSGGEPTIGRTHLLELLKLFSEHPDTTFIIETNGILIGYDESYARDVARFSNIVVRVSFKGVEPSEFAMLTGARPEAFELQFKALENLINAGLRPGREVYAAAMIGFSREEAIRKFVKRLEEIHESLKDVDWEYVILYPHVKKKLENVGLKPLRAVEPGKVPKEMI